MTNGSGVPSDLRVFDAPVLSARSCSCIATAASDQGSPPDPSWVAIAVKPLGEDVPSFRHAAVAERLGSARPSAARSRSLARRIGEEACPCKCDAGCGIVWH